MAGTIYVARDHNGGLGQVMLISTVAGILVALGTVLEYLHASFWQELTQGYQWAPELALLTLQVVGQALWYSGSVSFLIHWMTISAGLLVILGFLVVWHVARKRRTAL